MKRFAMIVLVCILTVLMVPVSAAEEVQAEDIDITALSGSEIVPFADVTYNSSTGFGIQNMRAVISMAYTAKSNFSHASVYLYIQKYVSGAWVAARTDVQSSWHDVSYDWNDVFEHSLTLTSGGRYRGKITGWIYGTDNTNDPINSVKEQEI